MREPKNKYAGLSPEDWITEVLNYHATDPCGHREDVPRLLECRKRIELFPDLLKSCIVAVDWLSDKGVSPDHVELKRIRAAISKAEGE